jgi:hypothetical protein
MKLAIATLASASPYSQSRAYGPEVEKLPRETADAYEERTWRNKCHTLPDGKVFIPPMAFKMAVDNAAKMLGRQIPGKGKSTYTKFFLSGVLVMDPIILPHSKDSVQRDRIYANADGVRGSGKRVWRNFPRIDEWKAEVPFHVLADEITPDVFEEHLKQAGAFVGIGRFRPQSGGFYGRFEVKKITWN